MATPHSRLKSQVVNRTTSPSRNRPSFQRRHALSKTAAAQLRTARSMEFAFVALTPMDPVLVLVPDQAPGQVRADDTTSSHARVDVRPAGIAGLQWATQSGRSSCTAGPRKFLP